MYKYIILLSICCTFFACSDDEGNGNGGNGVLLFSIEDDKKLGAQLKAEVFANPQEYPVLDTTQYASAYSYLNGLKDQILNSGEIQYKDEFAWEIYIIDDTILNAFASPGGYIFIYTGIIDYLDKEDDLMGVLGHEMAHADLRHSVRQLQKEYGISLLLSIVLGQDASALSQVLASLAGNVASLKFSRDDETEADLASVEYLDPLPHRCDAAATFFKKMGNNSGTPTFLSTHPASEDRVNQIQAKALELACDTTYFNPSSYNTQFRDLLP